MTRVITMKTDQDLISWLKNTDHRPIGLVLGGGGARGCYEIGAWQAFEQAGIHFDVVAGTSIGALVGAIYTQQTLHPLVEFVQNLKPGTIAKDLFAFPETFTQLLKERRQIEAFLDTYILSAKGMNISPLKEALDRMFDYRKFKDSPINFACMTFNVTKRRPEAYFKDQMHQWNAQDIILASASCYPAFPMLEMDGELYMDGGYWDNVPVDLAVRMGAHRIFAINVEGPGLIQPLPRGAEVVLMKPMLPLGNFLDFDSRICVRSMNIGFLETGKFLGLFCGYLYTFTRNYLPDMYFMDSYLHFMFEAADIDVPRGMPNKIVKSVVGFHPSSLSRMNAEHYKYGELVGALAYLAGMDAARLYSYHTFILELLQILSSIRLEHGPISAEHALSWMESLSRQGLLAVMHILIRDEHGRYRDYMGLLRRLFPTEFYLAWVWYFLEAAYEHIANN